MDPGSAGELTSARWYVHRVVDEGRRRLLVVHHTPSPGVADLLDACMGVGELPELVDVEVIAEPALSATPSDVLAADAYLLLTPANIGYMSGALKHFFDTVYYPCLAATKGRPYGLIVHGNDDTTGAVRSVERIAMALQWRAVTPALSIIGAPGGADRAAARDAAATVAAALLE